jgi:aminoglycoside phosphotransferase (APT) family kinase protein
MSAVDKDTTAAAAEAERSRELESWVRHHYGEDFEPTRLATLDGHSGLTYGFDVVDTTGRVADALVLRLPPAGGRSRNADVLRQIPVLEAMSSAGVPVADVVSPGTDETWFGSPYLMTRRVPGQTVSIDVPDRPVTVEHVEQAIHALAAVHSVDWTPLAAAGWDSPADYRSELRLWDRARQKMATPELKEAAERLALELETQLPSDARTGIVHGDFQFSNLLFDQHNLTAVLDWEVASIGPRLLDLAWFAEINNPSNWAHDVYTAEIPGAEQMRAWYENAAGVTVEDGEFAFARALACYRFAVIAGLNVHLHRSGRRPDPHWEIIAPSIPVLLGQGLMYIGAG